MWCQPEENDEGSQEGDNEQHEAQTKWVGKQDGYVFQVSNTLVKANFTVHYIDRLKRNPNQFFTIPVGQRDSTELPPLPDSFPPIPDSLRCISNTKTEKFCVGYGLAAAMKALGDHEWFTIMRMVPWSVVATEDSNVRAFSEIDFFKMYFQNKKQRLYTAYMIKNNKIGENHGVASLEKLTSSLMKEDDLAVCQVACKISNPHARVI